MNRLLDSSIFTPHSSLFPPCLARYHSDTTPKGYRRVTEGTPKQLRSVIVPLWLRTPKLNESKRQPLRKGSARVAEMKVYPKGLFLTILEIQSQSNTILTCLYTQVYRWLSCLRIIVSNVRVFVQTVDYIFSLSMTYAYNWNRSYSGYSSDT